MKLIQFVLLCMFTVLLAACQATAIPTPSSLPVTPITVPSPTLDLTLATTDTPSPKITETPTKPPTRTLIPTPTPYDKIPEQANDGWGVASLVDVGIDPLKISQMLGFIYHGNLSGETLTMPNGARKYEHIHSILIVKDGRLVFDEYFYYYSPYSTHHVASVTKSFTSLLVGSAIEQGYLKGVEEKILPYFPEYLPLQEPGTQAENITIEDLLTMRSGWECDDWDPASRTYYLKQHPDESDSIGNILNFPMETLPGTLFSYCTSGTVVLNALIARASGIRLSGFANQALLEPLGIRSATWDSSFDGFAGILTMRPRDMAKIGLLMLQNGNWQGNQIISEDWIRQSTDKHVILPFNETWGNWYGYLWWLSDVQIGRTQVHSFAASGYGGQVIAIFPELSMVVVITGGNYDNDKGQPFELMERFILPAVLTHSVQPVSTLTATTAASTIEIPAYGFPETIDPTKRYLFYLHGKIIEDQGLPAISPDYGEYEYAAILEKLASHGFTVISEQRPKNTDSVQYAERITEQVKDLLKAGVPAGNITVVGASKGADIAIHVSHMLENETVNYVLLGACHADEVEFLKQNDIFLYGNILAIYDSVDTEYAGSCDALFAFSEGRGLAHHAEIVLHVGTGHGILYKPLDEWVLPTVKWASEDQTP
jgi:CubicO group peptidase (beta-lactamase class C family)